MVSTYVNRKTVLYGGAEDPVKARVMRLVRCLKDTSNNKCYAISYGHS